MILDHQDAQRFAAFNLGMNLGRRDGLGPFHDLGLDFQGEARALGELGRHGDVAAHDVGLASRDGQAQTRPAKAPRRRCVDLG